MFVVNNVIIALAQILDTVLGLYVWIVIGAAVVSWVRPDPYNPIVRTLAALTEPVLYRIRKWLPFTFAAGIDFSPIVLILGVQLVKNILVRSLFQFAGGM